MKNFLLSLDIYGAKPSFFFNGNPENKTFFGVVMTIVTVLISTGAFVLFGQDFFFKLNPSVVSEEKFEEDYPIIYPTTDTFTVFYELIDARGAPIDPLSLKIQIVTSYSYLERDENNNYQIILDHTEEPKPCSQTKAVENPDLKSVNLDNVYCFDWEELTAKLGEPVPLGGFPGDDKISIFRIEVRNTSKSDEISHSYKELKDEISSRMSFKTTYPSFVFDINSVDNPIKKTYESFIYNLDASMKRIDRNFFDIGILEDDIGWIFKSTKTYEAIKRDKYETELSVIRETDESKARVEFYNFFGYLSKKNVIFRRKYMKIQEVAAQTGGFIKILNLTCGFWVQMYSRFYMTSYLIDFEQEGKPNLESVSFEALNNRNRSAVDLRGSSFKGSKKISFTNYLLGQWKLKKNEDFNKFKAQEAKMNEKVDLLFLNHFFSSLKKFIRKNILVEEESKTILAELENVFNYSTK